MGKAKLKKIVISIFNNIKNIFSFYYIWITIFLVIIAIISLKVSLYYDTINNAFYSSMYSNVFTGIIVGLVVFLVTGFKNFQRYDLETKLNKMEEIHKEILEFNAMYKKLLFNKEINYEDMAYDLICKAQSINTEISYQYSETNNINFKTFFIKEFSFNVAEKSTECNNIRELILNNTNCANYRKDVNNCFKNYSEELLTLNKKILIKIRDYKSKIKIIDTSLL